MNLLFVCTAGENRSRTAAEMYGGKYCGMYDLTDAALKWADKVYVFEKKHETYIMEHFFRFYGKVVNLDIPDIYDYGVEPLKKVVRARMKAKS
ncbi:MAG: hypothetical protein KAW41_06240 [Candidatus Diapherotrites archaeon]|nr:hypothetical protein [Candidatus Diapherotrites archaeon]